MREYRSYRDEKFPDKLRHVIEEIWPSIYNLINSFLAGVINFFKFLLRGFFPGG